MNKQSEYEEVSKEANYDMKAAEKIKKETNKKYTHFIVTVLVVSILFICVCILNKKFNLTDIIERDFLKRELEIESVMIDNNTIYISFHKPIFTRRTWYRVLSDDESVTDWIEITKENKIEASENIKYIQMKNEKNESKKLDITNYLNVIYELNVKLTLDKIMLTKGEVKELEIDTKCIGNPMKEINIWTNDQSVLKIENHTITALESGKINLIVSDNYGHEVIIPVTVTDLISLPEIKEDKELLKTANKYTKEEAHLLDELLDYKVKEAGEGTRDAVVATAKFITMEFQYKIPYFFENGRYQNNGYSKPCDGEGRYYHKGLYLSEDKYETIKDSRTGPAMWGAPLRELSTGTTQYNGLDCSGFVSWALYNAGFDPGDIGAGPDEYFATIPGYGKEYDLTVDILKSRNYQGSEI